MPTDLLGNIGEPLDHSQSERLHEDGDPENISVADSAHEWLSPAGESPSPIDKRSGGEPENYGEDVTAILEAARDVFDLEMLLQNREVSNSSYTSARG